MLLSDENALLLNRPPSTSEKRDIKARTDELLRQVREQAKDQLIGYHGDLTKERDHLTKARDLSRGAVRKLIYIGFGFRLMHEAMSNEAYWKEFLNEKFPTEVTNAKWYIAIGRHFKFDQSYIGFLKQCKYPIDARYEAEHQNLTTQINYLEKQGITLNSPVDLLRHIQKGELPEIKGRERRPDVVSPTSSVDPVVSSVIVSEPTISEAVVADTKEHPDPEPTRPEPVNVEEQVFLQSLHNLQDILKDLQTARNLFRTTVQSRPLNEWGEENIRALKDAIRPAKEILDELFDL